MGYSPQGKRVGMTELLKTHRFNGEFVENPRQTVLPGAGRIVLPLLPILASQLWVPMFLAPTLSSSTQQLCPRRTVPRLAGLPPARHPAGPEV